MIRVNLLPKAGRAATGGDWRTVGTGFGGLGLLAVLGALWWMVSSQASSLEGQITSIQTEIKRLEVVAKQVDQYKAEKKLLEERLRVIQTLLVSQSIPVHLMQVLNDELPDEIWLNSISMTGNKLILRGYSFTDIGIANFMTRLGKKAPLVREVELVVSEQAELQKVPLKKFEVVCTVAG
ncbi:MAG: PilN domain-containing protein [Candidatus Methylomirabilales bacterium]